MHLILDGPIDAEDAVILAHGAGAAMDSPWMDTIAALLAERGIRVGRFEFPYMEARRGGSRRPPDREPVLRRAWHDALDAFGRGSDVVIGGKSMGGRIATLIADEAAVRGVVCFGYPFHPAGRPDRLRTEHLAATHTPTLIVQGERDALGSRAEVQRYKLRNTVQMQWLPDGDHSLTPRKASGVTLDANMCAAADGATRFMHSVPPRTGD